MSKSRICIHLNMTSNNDIWPKLPLSEWKDTYETLHRWTQIVGKIRLALAPFENHWWNTTLYINSRGLTTSAMPYDNTLLQIDFDFIDHNLLIYTSLGNKKTIKLESQTVSDFYKEIMYILAELDIYVPIWSTPVEIQDCTPFEEDFKHASYDPVQYIGFGKFYPNQVEYLQNSNLNT